MGGIRLSRSSVREERPIEELTRRYYAALLRYFARRGVAQADVADLAQRVFVKMCQRRTLDEIDNLDGYLFAVAATTCTDHFRQYAVRHATGDHVYRSALHRDEEIDPERIVAGRQELASIMAALDQMPARMRNIFILARLENIARAEIAARLGISKRLVEHQLTLATACLAARRERS